MPEAERPVALDAGDEWSAPRDPAWRDRLLETAVLAAALVAGAEGRASVRAHPAARMCLLATARRAALLGVPPQCDILAIFDADLRRLAQPGARRLAVAGAMNGFVGTPWAATILRIAEAVGAAQGGITPAGRRSLHALRIALGLPPGAREAECA